jgi:hypothetical protein
MKLHHLTILSVAALFALPLISARAQTYDLQFTYNGPFQQGSAVLASPLNYTWNNLDNTTFTDTTGTDTFGFTDTAATAGAEGAPNTDADAGTQNLFASNLYNPGTFTFTLTGLAHDQSYDLVIYAGGNGSTPSTYSVAGEGTTPFTSYTTGASYSISDGNNVAYADFNVVSDDNGTLVVTDNNNGGNGYFSINGFQLAAAPEPSTYVLLGLGGAALLIVRNRRKAQSL